MTNWIHCLDVGGTNTRSALISAESNPRSVAVQMIPTPKKNLVELSDFIMQLHDDSVQSKEFPTGDKVSAISIAMPGPVKGNILLSAPPLRVNQPFDIASVLRQKTLIPIFLENDVNAALLAEGKQGVGNQWNSFYLLSLSTGIGSGIWLNGKPLGGTSGEFGHNVIERDSKRSNDCPCGNNGCWAAQASGFGLQETGKKLFKQDRTPEEWFSAAKKKDSNAKKMVEIVRDYNAQGIGMMANAIEVQGIVVMGSLGLSQFQSIIPSKEEIKRYCINPIPPIVPTTLGFGIGLLGAKEVALDRMRKGWMRT